MNWDEARKAAASPSITIGAHTLTHEVLSKQSIEEQTRELVGSRERLAEAFGEAPDLLAYPVGAPGAFTEDTKRISKEAGYTAAFSFYGGASAVGALDPYDLRRVAFDYDATVARCRAATATMAMTGRYWF